MVERSRCRRTSKHAPGIAVILFTCGSTPATLQQSGLWIFGPGSAENAKLAINASWNICAHRPRITADSNFLRWGSQMVSIEGSARDTNNLNNIKHGSFAPGLPVRNMPLWLLFRPRPPRGDFPIFGSLPEPLIMETSPIINYPFGPFSTPRRPELIFRCSGDCQLMRSRFPPPCRRRGFFAVAILAKGYRFYSTC